MAGALEGLRVLELSGLYGAYCGKLFADLGAAVTLVEPPGGSPMRRKPPFSASADGSGQSLPFAYFAANKRSVMIDLSIPGGQEHLRKLAGTADLVILSDHPNADSIDLEALRRDRASLICARITPYGSQGPYADFSGDDLTLLAMGGLLTMAGFPGEAPVAAHGEQGLLAADQFAAVASLAAVLRAERTGQGEMIDISIQEAVVMALENAAQTYKLEGKIRNRSAGARRAGTGIFPCRDGDVYLLAGGIGETAMWGNFARWLAAEGVEGADLFASPDWSDADAGADDAFRRIFLPYAAGKTKNELYAQGKKWRVAIAPMSTPADLLENRQLRHRGFFVPIPEGGASAGVMVPGAPYKLSATPWRLHSPAPPLPQADDGRLNEENI